MTETCFVDTNVLVYARDAADPEKQSKASVWLEFLWQHRLGRLSTQVLNEYYVTVTRKLVPGLGVQEAREDVRDLMVWRPVILDGVNIEIAWTIQDRYGLSWWDCLIVAAVQVAGCRHLLSEDLQHKQDLDGVKVLNPFLTTPDAVSLGL